MSEPQRERLSPAWIALLALCVLWTLALLQWGQTLNLDELEFFRATRWIAEGRLPFRDYWEHHLPLQWLLFAPIAAMVSNGPGAAAIVALRWAQVPLWIATFAIVMVLMRRAGIGLRARWAALASLLSSIWFTRAALQYRVDVPGHLAYLAALWLIVFRKAKWIPFAAGALFALAVLANMRLAPLVVITVVLLMFWRPDEERWAWNADALRIAAGGLAVALAFVACLEISGAMPGFAQGVIWYNRTSDRLLPTEARSFLMRLVGPFLQRDVGGAAFLIAAAAGLGLALRRIARPGLLQFLALLAIASLAAIAMLGIQYEYHFQTPYLLLLPFAAASLDRLRGRFFLAGVIVAASLLFTGVKMAPDFGKALAYQDRVMLEVDRRTEKTEKVWDSTGYALRREPAYRYWFLPAGVRLLADRGLVEPYDIEQIAANPPAAIIFNARTRWWMLGRPRLTLYVLHHYLPLYQNLWLPGMSAAVGPEPSRTTWTVPRTGRYDIYVSELLVKHPWFARPAEYGLLEGTELAIPLDRLPLVPATELQWRVNGTPAAAGTTTLDLQRGSRLELSSSLRARVGVLVVPHGVRTLSIMPDAPVPF